MNILQSLVQSAKKKKDELEDKIAQQVFNKPAPPPPNRIPYAPGKAPVQPSVPSFRDQATQSAKKAGTVLGLGVTRGLTGLAQEASGVVDLVSPGTGTSRVSKKLDRFAKDVDQTVKTEGADNPFTKPLYSSGQVIPNAASFYGGGAAANVAERSLAKAPVVSKATKVIAPVTTKADEIIAKLDQGNRAAKVAATGARTLRPSNAANVAANTVADLGAESGKGNDISKRDVATSVGANLVLNTGVPMAGRAVAETTKHYAPRAAQKATDAKDLVVGPRRPLDISNDDLEAVKRVAAAREGRMDATELSDRDIGTYRALQEHLGSDQNDHTAIDDLLGDFRTYDSKQANRQTKINKAKQTVTSVSRKYQPGLSMQAVDDEGNPVSGLSGKPLQPMTDEAVIAPDAPTPIQAILDKRQAELRNEVPVEVEAPENAPTGNPRIVENRLTRRGKAGDQPGLAPETRAGIEGEHEVRSTQGLADQAAQEAGALDDESVIQEAYRRLARPDGEIDDQAVAFSNEAIQRAQAAGQFEDAINIHDALSQQLRAHGQAIQAAKLLYNLTPDGMYFKAVRDITRANEALAPKGKAPKQIPAGDLERLGRLRDNIKNAPEGEARDRAKAILGKFVADQMPRGKSSDILSVWKAGLLSGTKTILGGPASNAVFAGLKKVSDLPAAAVDAAISLKTGQRTKTATLRGTAEGTAEGARKGFDTFRTGIDERDVTNGKYDGYGELNFKNPVINAVFGKTSNQVFRTLSAGDQPFYYAAAKNTLNDLALAEAKNKGLKGQEADAFVTNLVANPTKQMAQTAKDAADKAVLAYDTVASKVIQGANQSIDRMDVPPVAKATAKTVIGVLAPFVKVPSAFISRTVDFTPLGVGREVFEQVSNHKFDQRALSEAIGEGITGSGVIALGMALAQSGQLSGNYPKNDPKEAARWKAEGITPNSVKLGDKWYSLNYLGPLGLLFNAGKQIEDAEGESGLAKAAAAVGGLAQSLLGQSFLQGFSGFSDAIQDPERSAKSFINSQFSSLVPSWSNDLANLTDKYQRQADTPIEAAKNRIPGLRDDNKKKQDVYGNKLEQVAGQGNTVNPLKPSTSTTTKSVAIEEVSRLHALDPKNKDLQVTPSAVPRTISVEDTKVDLDNDQRYALQERIGQATQERWNELIQTDEYQQLSDADKAKALTDLRQTSQELETRAFVEENNLATYKKKPGASQRVLERTGDVTRFAKTGDADGDLTPLEKYEAAKDEFDAESKDWSNVKKAKKQKALTQLEVAKDFDNDVLTLYGMGKADVYDLISSDPNGKKLAEQIVKYGDALEAAGAGKNKFRNSKGVVSIRPKETGRGGRGTKIKPSDFKTPYDELLKSRSKGAQLARSAGLAKRS